MILFILDIEKKRTYMAGIALRYLLFTVFIMAFGGIYEYFSFGVWSPAMVYAAAFPLILGAVPALSLTAAKRSRPMPGRIPLMLYHAGVITLTVGSIVRGILEIYGTTNALVSVYYTAGLALISAALLLFAAALKKKRMIF